MPKHSDAVWKKTCNFSIPPDESITLTAGMTERRLDFREVYCIHFKRHTSLVVFMYICIYKERHEELTRGYDRIMDERDISEKSPKGMIKDFTKGHVGRQLIAFATPLFLSNFLQIVYNMVDMIIVGKVNGSVGLSAVSIGGDVTRFLTFMAMGFSAAGQVIIAQYIGANQREELGKFIGTMVTFLFSCMSVLSIVCLLIRGSILTWMNTPPESWDEALRYSTTCMIGLIFINGYNVVSAILRGMGDSKHPFLFISIAAVLNIGLDILFVGVYRWGAFGAALATVISQTVSFLTALVFLYRKRSVFGFTVHKRDFRIDRKMLSPLLLLGIPMVIKHTSIHFSKLFVNSWINSYGVVVSAVAGIGNKLNSVSNLISNSMNTAGASMVGQNIGAGEYKRIPKIMLVAFGTTLAICSFMALLLGLFPAQIFSIFTNDMSILDVAMDYLPVGILLFFASAFRSPMNALINGSGNYRVNFAVAILDGIINRIGLSLLLGLFLKMGYMGFWYGDALAGFTPFFIGIVFFYSGRWKTRKYVIKKPRI